MKIVKHNPLEELRKMAKGKPTALSAEDTLWVHPNCAFFAFSVTVSDTGQ